MTNLNKELLDAARSVVLPSWATHVAVRNDASKAEPAAWLGSVKDYVDEDPASLKSGDWAGSYRHRYWVFIHKDELLEQGNE